MGNHIANKTKPAGIEEIGNTVIVGLEVMQKVKEMEKIKGKTVEVFELEAKGRLLRAVNPVEYIKIKAYDGGNPNKARSNNEKTH